MPCFDVNMPSCSAGPASGASMPERPTWLDEIVLLASMSVAMVSGGVVVGSAISNRWGWWSVVAGAAVLVSSVAFFAAAMRWTRRG